MEKHKILMVCMGNICRSPAAEAIVRALGEKAGLSRFLEVDSAGTHAHHGGEQPDSRMCKAAAKRGYNLKGLRSRRLVDADFARFDRILAMDRQNMEYLRDMCPPAWHGKLRFFMDYAEGAGPGEIPDPYYGNAEGFERVLDLCEAAGRGLLRELARGTR